MIYKIKDLMDVYRGASPRPIIDFLTDKGYRWLKISDFKIYDRYVYDTKEYIKEMGVKKTRFMPKGTLILTNSATPGIPIFLGNDMCLHDGFLYFQNINEKIINIKFLYYWFLFNKNKIVNQANGSVFQNLKKEIVENFEIDLPTIDIQHKIVILLEKINDKIELNNKINDNLFEILNKLFIHDYLENDKYNLWNNVTMNDITSRFATGLNPRKNFVLGQGNNYYVTIKNIPNNRVVLDSKCDKVDDDAIKKINKRSDLKKGDVLFSGIGTIGRTYLIKETPKNWNISESVFTIRPNENISSEFLYLLLLSRDMQNYAISKASGSVQKGIRMADLKLYKLKLPPKEWMENFTEKTTYIIDKIYLNYAENETLEQLRDTLLPKLMNGEIDLDKIEI